MVEQIAHHIQLFVQHVGYPGLFVLIMLESTLVPIPSELIMPFAGFLAAQGTFSLPIVILVNSTAALLGSGICYWIGAAGGKPLILRYGKYAMIRAKDIERTERYFARHGKATIFVARFLPVVRHIISVPAGIARMRLGPFFTQTFLGSTIWGTTLIMIGYELGARWDTVAEKLKRVDSMVGAAIVLACVAAAVWFVVRRRREAASGVARNNAD